VGLPYVRPHDVERFYQRAPQRVEIGAAFQQPTAGLAPNVVRVAVDFRALLAAGRTSGHITRRLLPCREASHAHASRSSLDWSLRASNSMKRHHFTSLELRLYTTALPIATLSAGSITIE